MRRGVNVLTNKSINKKTKRLRKMYMYMNEHVTCHLRVVSRTGQGRADRHFKFFRDLKQIMILLYISYSLLNGLEVTRHSDVCDMMSFYIVSYFDWIGFMNYSFHWFTNLILSFFISLCFSFLMKYTLFLIMIICVIIADTPSATPPREHTWSMLNGKKNNSLSLKLEVRTYARTNLLR